MLFDRRKTKRLLEEVQDAAIHPTCLTEAQAIDFVAGACKAEDKNMIDRHLLTCEACTGRVRTLYDQQDEHPLTMTLGHNGKPKKLR